MIKIIEIVKTTQINFNSISLLETEYTSVTNEARRSDSLDKMTHKMDLQEISKKIINCIKPSLLIEYFYGIIRYRINGSALSPMDTRMKILSIIVTTVWICTLLFVCIVPNVNFILKNKITMGKVMRESTWFISTLQYAVSNIMLIFWHSENNVKILETFAKIDIILHADMNRNFYKTSQKECNKLIFGFLIFCSFLIATIYVNEEQFDYLYIFNLFLYFEMKIEIVVLWEFLHLLKYRLSLIKNYFEKFMTNQNKLQNTLRKNVELEGIINYIGTASVTNNTISILANVYKDAGDACNTINNIFNFFITSAIISTFVSIISFFWASLKFLKIKGVETTTVFMVIVSTLAELISVFPICCYCEKILEVKDEIIVILNKIVIDENIPKIMRDHAKVFLEITDIWPMTIHAYNMFQINKNLILKFVSICTSYLIVVIQFDEYVQ
nr:gustatory receptor 27.2 [Papilio dardanus]